MRSDVDVVRAFLSGEEAAYGGLQCEIRAGRETTDPRSGEPVAATPIAVLWSGDQPVATLLGSVVLVNQGARERKLRTLVAERAERRGHEVRLVREPELWRLTA